MHYKECLKIFENTYTHIYIQARKKIYLTSLYCVKKDYENHIKKNIQILQESLILLWRWTMRINALPNALGNALFPFGAEAQGGVIPPP